MLHLYSCALSLLFQLNVDNFDEWMQHRNGWAGGRKGGGIIHGIFSCWHIESIESQWMIEGNFSKFWNAFIGTSASKVESGLCTFPLGIEILGELSATALKQFSFDLINSRFISTYCGSTITFPPSYSAVNLSCHLLSSTITMAFKVLGIYTARYSDITGEQYWKGSVRKHYILLVTGWGNSLNCDAENVVNKKDDWTNGLNL